MVKYEGRNRNETLLLCLWQAYLSILLVPKKTFTKCIIACQRWWCYDQSWAKGLGFESRQCQKNCLCFHLLRCSPLTSGFSIFASFMHNFLVSHQSFCFFFFFLLKMMDMSIVVVQDTQLVFTILWIEQSAHKPRTCLSYTLFYPKCTRAPCRLHPYSSVVFVPENN